MATLVNMTEEVKQFAMKIKSMKKIKAEKGIVGMLKKKPSYADYIDLKGTGTKDSEQIEHFFATYAHDFPINGINGLGGLELILHDKVLKWVIDGKENVLVCGSMSGDQMQVAVCNWITDTFGDHWPTSDMESGVFVAVDLAEEGKDQTVTLEAFAFTELEEMVELAVHEGDEGSTWLAGNHEFYDVVSGTSPGSKYVVVGIGKKTNSNIAIRYSGTTLSLRCDPAPTKGEAAEFLTLLGFRLSSGSHVSCHLTVVEGDPMKRYFLLLTAALDAYFDFCDIDIQTIKEKGA